MSAPKPRKGRCNARLRGDRAGAFCRRLPARGRARCRLHGGATPRGKASPHFKHGLDSRYVRPEELVGELRPAERKRVQTYRSTLTSELLRERLAILCVLQDRAIAHGDGALPATYALAIATTARAKVLADRDRGAETPELPQIVEVFEGKTREDFRREQQELTRRVLEGASA